MSEVVLVSACLLGRPCRYDGGHSLEPGLQLGGAEVVEVCPEELGGLGTPRPAAELRVGDGADVLDGRARVETIADGRDCTHAFLAGARSTLSMARESGAGRAVLKQGSPSCGSGRVTRDGRSVPGRGVTAALLEREGIPVEPAG